MCGICGYISKRKIGDDALEAMNDTMYHRGPNDSGIYQVEVEDKYFGFAQRRLSIMDLSVLGHQPMFSETNEYVIVFNGEVYNYRDLREELIEKGHIFKSDCDTEVILAAYMEWGDAAIEKLDGMFAFAILNLKTGRTVFARDRIGKKPLYYYWKDGELIFGSELKAIVKHPNFKKNLNENVIKQFLCYQYINEPNTIYCDTYKLPAGHYMVFKNGQIEIKKYWDIYEKYIDGKKKVILDYKECKEELKNNIYHAVKKRLVADVPVGSFLSGGIDSTLVTAIANDIVKEKIKTFTIGFEDKKRNEAQFAKESSQYLGTDHYEVYVTERDMLNLLDDMCFYFDEPFADPSELPTMLVSKVAKEKVTVALSGDGGDEFFCGYSMYDYVYYSQMLDKLSGVGNKFIPKSIKKKLPAEVVALLSNRNPNYKVQLFSDLPEMFVSKMMKNNDVGIKFNKERLIDTENWQERRMLLDMYTYLPEDVLTKADRASMKYSLEMRCPLLDTNVMEYSFRVPHEYKYKARNKKYILKDILYDYVPKKMMDRPKNGFGVPLGKWLRTFLKDEINRVSQKDYLDKQGIFNYEAVQELISKVDKSDKKPYPKILWAFYVFQMWFARYIEN